MKIKGNLVDIFNRDIYTAEIYIQGSGIKHIKKIPGKEDNYILPGLTDAHIHIESTMCTPGAFAVEAVSRGTIAVVSDPHEIANVLGEEGVHFMIEDSYKVPLKFYFGAPSCVPATPFETAGATLGITETDRLLQMKEIKYLAEMMNFPGVISGDRQVLGKIELARKYSKPVDGHAPGLTGENLRKYIEAGISTDHECSSLDEAREKIKLGMKILIREGSAARNLDSLKELIRTSPDMVMLCSDDLHPEMLMKRHINKLVAKLVKDGFDLFNIIRSCTFNPALHYGLENGLLRPGDPADFIIVDNPAEMNILETWINGKKVYEKGKVLFGYDPGMPVNRFRCSPVKKSMISVQWQKGPMRVISASDGELLTGVSLYEPPQGEFVEPDTETDILKIVVKDRYNDSPPSVGFIKGFGIKRGAFASSVAHDSHNIIAIGTNDNDILISINEIVKMNGGLAVSIGGKVKSLQLNVAGIMSDKPCKTVARDYEYLSGLVREMGSPLSSPFMTLSFMALLVIPELKISDRGLFDGKIFQFVPLFIR